MITRVTRDEIADLNEAAATFYRAQLVAPEHEGPRQYLTERGFAHLLGETRWTVGYAPAGWTSLHDHLTEAGHSEDAMLAAGLISISRLDTPIDRFRNRLTFGVRDLDDSLVGFTARVGPTAPDGTPKYLNTPRTIAYDKSSVLFGLGEAAAARPAYAVAVAEGPLDVVAIDLVGDGRFAALALCGTSLTAAHARHIRDVGTPTIVAFDDDAAGHRALERAIPRLTPFSGEPRAARIALGLDPAGLYTRLGPDSLRAALDRSSPASEVVVDRILSKWSYRTSAPTRDLLALRDAAQALTRIAAPDMARHAARLTEILGLEPSAVTRELTDAASARRDPHPTPGPSRQPPHRCRRA